MGIGSFSHDTHRSPTGGHGAGRQLRDSGKLVKDNNSSGKLGKDNNNSICITVLCGANDDDHQAFDDDSEATRQSVIQSVTRQQYQDEFDAAEAGEVGLAATKSQCYRSPSPPRYPASAQLHSFEAAIHDFALRAAAFVVVCCWLFTIALLALALLGRGGNNNRNNVIEDDGSSSLDDSISADSNLIRKPSRGPRSLLAAGLSSVAAKLDKDTVDKYARPRGYLRKSLMSARVQMETKQHDMEDLQEYYEKQIKSISDEFKAQKDVYEERLHDKDSHMLNYVFGDEDKPAADSSDDPFAPKAFSGATGNQSYESCLDRRAFVSHPSEWHEYL